MTKLRKALRLFIASAHRRLREVFDLEGSGQTAILSAIVGAAAGICAFLFSTGLNWLSKRILFEQINYLPPAAGTEQNYWGFQLDVVWWAVLLFPALGGLLSGWLVYTYCPEAEGHGSDAMVRSYHRLGGFVRARVPLIKGLASIITISTGGSAGREGPIAQVGAGVGAIFANLLKLNNDLRRFLMLAGASGGIAAVFHAPLGAALFVCEVLYASAALETSAIIFATISAVVSFSVYSSLHNWIHGAQEGVTAVSNSPGLVGGVHELVVHQPLQFHGLQEIPFYVGVAVVCALSGYLYVKVFYGLRDHVFRKLPVPHMIKPAIGGLLLSLLILGLRIPGPFATGIPHVMAGGYGWIQQSLDGKMTLWWSMAILALAKMLATSLTISSGGSGGVFAPSLFIGAMLGGAYGWLCHWLFPTMVPQPEVFVMVGMGGFFAGVAKVPLTSIVMVSEMTHSFDLLVPLMLVSVLTSALLSRRISLYEEQVLSPVDSPVHAGDFLVDVLANMRVEQIWDKSLKPCLIPEGMSLQEMLRTIDQVETNYFPVVDGKGHLNGIIAFSDLKAVLSDHASDSLVIASDIASSPVVTVTPNDDLHTALRRVSMKNIEEIPIVAPNEPTRVIGMLRRKDLISAYNGEISRLQRHHHTKPTPDESASAV